MALADSGDRPSACATGVSDLWEEDLDKGNDYVNEDDINEQDMASFENRVDDGDGHTLDVHVEHRNGRGHRKHRHEVTITIPLTQTMSVTSVKTVRLTS